MSYYTDYSPEPVTRTIIAVSCISIVGALPLIGLSLVAKPAHLATRGTRIAWYLHKKKPLDIPAWSIERATQRLSEDQSCGNTRGTLTSHPMNILQVYRECFRHGTSKKHSFGGT